MSTDLRFLLPVVLGSVTCVAALAHSPVFAQQSKHDELVKSARQAQKMGALAIQVAAGLLGVAIFYGAYSTYSKGFKITQEKRLEGRPAVIVAAVLVAVGIGVVVGGIMYGYTVYP